MIALGTGGIKPCVSSFGGDQFAPEQKNELKQFFSMFYLSINAGSLISTYLTPVLRQDVKCFSRNDCYPLAFGVPAILMILAVGLFILGRFVTKYIMVPPQKENILVKVCSCITVSVLLFFFFVILSFEVLTFNAKFSIRYEGKYVQRVMQRTIG